MEMLFFAIVWLSTVWYFTARSESKPIIIGLPDVDKGEVFWFAKSPKTLWERIKEQGPAWGLIGFTLGLIIMGTLTINL